MVTTTVPASLMRCCWAAASSKVVPLAMDWATAPESPAALEFRPGGAEDRLGGTKSFEKLGRGAGAQAGDQPQCDPVKLFLAS